MSLFARLNLPLPPSRDGGLIHGFYEKTAQNAAIRCAIGLGAFDTVPLDGKSISAGEIAAKSKADKQLVGTYMWTLLEGPSTRQYLSWNPQDNNMHQSGSCVPVQPVTCSKRRAGSSTLTTRIPAALSPRPIVTCSEKCTTLEGRPPTRYPNFWKEVVGKTRKITPIPPGNLGTVPI